MKFLSLLGISATPPWIDHPVRKELQNPPSELGLLRGFFWMLGASYLLYALFFQFGGEIQSDALPGKLISFTAVAGFWSFAIGIKPFHQRLIRKVSWIADTTPAEPVTLKIEGEGRGRTLSLVDSAGNDMGCFDLGAVSHSELPVRWPKSIAAELHRNPDSQRNVIVVWPGYLLNGNILNTPKFLRRSPNFKRSGGPILLLIFAGFFLALAVANSMVYFNFRATFELGEAARRWPQVNATITKAVVETSSYQKGATKYSRGVTVEVFRPAVRYTYAPETPGPRLRQGSDILWGLAWSAKREEAERQLSHFPVGAEVKVRYNPNEPQTVVIEPGTDSSIAEEMSNALLWLRVNGGIALLLAGFSIRLIMRFRKPSSAGATYGDDRNRRS